MMKKMFLIFMITSTFFNASAQSKTGKQKIKEIMEYQVLCWNAGDIKCFMQGYWKSDSLQFIGRNGITYGWQATLNNYMGSYPNKTLMGILTFDKIRMERLGKKVMRVTGNWKLILDGDEPGGYFTLIWKKIKGDWVIVYDHTC